MFSAESHRSGRCRVACTYATALVLVLLIIGLVVAAVFVPPAISSYIHRMLRACLDVIPC